MKPQPSEINFITINAETEEKEINMERRIDTSSTPFVMEVTEEMVPSQYAFEFLWKEGNEMKGRSMLNFRLE